jgi:alkylation response protein AidB-like acyl-CoA dehydrogenase
MARIGADALDTYRCEARCVSAGWETEVGDWARNGHLPPRVFVELGEAKLFSRRWEPGRTPGLPLGLALVAELTRLSGGLGLAVGLHNEVFTGILTERARGDFQQSVRADALSGQAVGCVASTEPTGGSDVASARTRARRTGNGWHLVGSKRYITNAGVATHAIVLAQVEDGSAAKPALFLVSMRDPGVRVTGFFSTLGVRECDTAAIELDAHLEDNALIGTVGAGLVYLLRGLQLERIASAVQVLTGADTALGLAVAHARSRTQFGRRLIEHQALKHRLADAAADLAAAHALLDGIVDRAVDGHVDDREICALKLVSARTAGRVVDDALQVLGGRGYTANFPLERIQRDCRLARIGGGTDELMREMIGTGLDRPNAGFDRWIASLHEADVPDLVVEGDP